MVFADLAFLYVFFPLVFGVHAVVPLRWRNIVLVLASLCFYAWGEPIWVSLIIVSAFTDYNLGRAIAAESRKHWRTLYLAMSLCVNLGLLVTFKYSGFFIETLNRLGLSLPVVRLSLPVGISFYTFQTISYVVDVYRGRTQAQEYFFDYLLFVSLFFQLVAGPIVRYLQIATEIRQRHLSLDTVAQGLFRFVIGLFKKVMVANEAGRLASLFLDGPTASATILGAWTGAILFSLQIYYDFSGYSDMAIGMGKMFGFSLPENFNYPYTARSVKDFWRRWHMTLGSFFRDYVYIPLGGNRHLFIRNVVIVWFLTGLWHGASWNFVLWGLYFACFLLLEKFLGAFFIRWPRVLSHIYLLLIVVVGWVLFYFTDIDRAFHHITIMFGFSGVSFSNFFVYVTLANHVFWLVGAMMFCIPIFPVMLRFLQAPTERFPRVIAVLATLFSLALLGFATAHLVGRTYNPFLYYRF